MIRDRNEYHSISDERLEVVIELVAEWRGCDPAAIGPQVREMCLADWPEGEEHQEWLDTAPVGEVADWCIAGWTE